MTVKLMSGGAMVICLLVLSYSDRAEGSGTKQTKTPPKKEASVSPKVEKPVLPSLFQTLPPAAYECILQSMTASKGSGALSTKSKEEMKQDLEKRLKELGEDTSSSLWPVKQAREYAERMIDAVPATLSFAATAAPGPAVVAASQGGSTVLLMRSLQSDTVFNTNRLDERQRATRIVQAEVLPTLGNIAGSKPPDGIGRVGVGVHYSSRNFLGDDVSGSWRCEYVAFVVGVDTLSRFSRGEATEDELFETADVFVLGRDSQPIKKVRLSPGGGSERE